MDNDPNEPLPINADSYQGYVCRHASAGTPVTMNTPIDVAAHRPVTYAFVLEDELCQELYLKPNGNWSFNAEDDDEENFLMFTINPATGVIKTGSDFAQRQSLPDAPIFRIQATCQVYPQQYDQANVRVGLLLLELCMNTDNFDGTAINSEPMMPKRTAREKLYKDHKYGLGIVMLCNDPLFDTLDPPIVESLRYYPLVLDFGTHVTATTTSVTIQFKYNHWSGIPYPGAIQLYKKLPNGNYEELLPDQDYIPAQLMNDDSNQTITLYVVPRQKHTVASEWHNPFKFNIKPDSVIKAVLKVNQAVIAQDHLKYINSSKGSFWNNYLRFPRIRHAFAAHGVYGSSADTAESHAEPTSLDLPQFALEWVNAQEKLEAMGFAPDIAALIGANNNNGLNVCVYYDHIAGNAILAFQGSDPLDLARPIFVSSGLFTQYEIDTLPDIAVPPRASVASRLRERIDMALDLLNNGAIHGSSAPDWVCNVAQSLGLRTPQYDDAMTIGINLPINFVSVNESTSFKKYSGWTITGHSLGGGLASAAAGVRGYLGGASPIIPNRLETFNAAGLHENTIRDFHNDRNILVSDDIVNGRLNRIIAYRTESDELTEGQEEYLGSSIVARRAAGRVYWLEDFANDRDTGAFSVDWPGHEMKSVFQGLCVDAIGIQIGANYIIDEDGTICYRGDRHLTAAGTVRIGTTPYAF